MLRNIGNLNLIFIAGLLIGIGFLSGWLGFLMVGDIAKSCKVVFVSKEAIIKLEEDRIKNNGSNNNDSNSPGGNMFFGKPNEALGFIEKIAYSFEDRRTKVVFISETSGLVKNGTPISELVHQETIDALKNQSLDKTPR